MIGFYLAAIELLGDHIVGGELEFITLEQGLYRINLIQYRDEAQTENTVIVDQYEVHIFSNKDDQLVSIHELNRVLYDDVEYTNPACADDRLQTSRLIWSRDIELNPEDYADEEGYYVVWERCCRNAAIKNIVSPLTTGMKYVVEIPPLWKDGKPFINSSPVLLKPLSDYACIGQLYYTEFTGEDRDGDSLVYRLATPLNSSVFTALPTPQPKPHIPVNFTEGYSMENMVSGSPPLRISSRGLLTVRPESTGLYVFSVIVEEWRNKQMIGYVQRDFQMLVISEGCAPPDPPEVGVQIPDDDDFKPKVDTLEYALADDKCFDFYVTNIKEGETINLRAEGVNFDEDVGDIFEITSAYIGEGVDTLFVQVCAPGCPPIRDGPFIIDLIAGNDACPLPQLDTARLMIEVEPPPNVFPTINNLNPEYVVNEDDDLVLNIVSDDGDGDFIEPMLIVENGADPDILGLSFETTVSEAGHLEGIFRWDTDCLVFDFSDQQQFSVGFLMEDLDTCDVENPNIKWVQLRLNLPFNTSPSVSMDSEPQLSIELGDTIDAIGVFADDPDGDLVELFLATDGGDSRDRLGVVFENAVGFGGAQSEFFWIAACDQLEITETTTYAFYFVAEDNDKCQIDDRDTLVFQVEVVVPENQKPDFRPRADTTIEVGELFELEITAFDPDSQDSITLSFFDETRLPNSPSLRFEPVTGREEVTSILSWQPECDLLDFGETSAFFDLSFLVHDDRCPRQELETMTFTVEVVETREAFRGFEPPNVFTPNGDGKNDVYTLTNLPTPRYNLPTDNCDDTFEMVRIFDRSGKVVFETTNREFIWDGENVSSGVYYYLIQYSRTEYKGYLQVLR